MEPAQGLGFMAKISPFRIVSSPFFQCKLMFFRAGTNRILVHWLFSLFCLPFIQLGYSTASVNRTGSACGASLGVTPDQDRAGSGRDRTRPAPPRSFFPGKYQRSKISYWHSIGSLQKFERYAIQNTSSYIFTNEWWLNIRCYSSAIKDQRSFRDTVAEKSLIPPHPR